MIRGTIVFMEPDPAEQQVGREQRGPRPGVIISDSNISDQLRYDVLAVVPLTRRDPEGEFYPKIRATPTGLRSDGWALPEMLRVVDRDRVTRRLGRVTTRELAAIEVSLRAWLRLPEVAPAPAAGQA